MASPVTDLMEYINGQVAGLSTSQLGPLTEVLDAAEAELTHALAAWKTLGKGMERFTPQMYGNALVQIRGALTQIRGELGEGIASNLRHGGTLAAHLATDHLVKTVEDMSSLFEGSVRAIPIEAATVLAEGKALVWKRFSKSAERYAGQVGEDIRKQLAIGVVRGETIDQLTTRLANLGGPRGIVNTGSQAEVICEGLFRRYRHFAERLAVTETVNAYNEFALVGMHELEEHDPGYFKKWDAALDGRTCPNCKEYDDLLAPLDKPFRGGIDHPPLHPRCRCATVVWRKEWTEGKYKDDLVGETVPHAKGTIASIPHRVPTPPPEPKHKEPEPATKLATPKVLEKPVTPITPKQTKAYEAQHDKFVDKLTDKERQSVEWYQGDGYKQINKYHRGLSSPTPKEIEFIHKDSANIDSALEKTKTTKEMRVFRGVESGVLPKDVQPGHIFTDKGYLSTTIDPKVTDPFKDSEGYVMHIAVPKGTPHGTITSTGNTEAEYLFPRNRRLEIISVEGNVIHAKMLDD